MRPWRLKLGTKILLPAIALFLVFATAVVTGFTQLHVRRVDARVVDDLESHARLMRAMLGEKEQEISLHARFLADMVNLSETIEDPPGGRSVLIYLLEYLRSKHVETRLYRVPPPTPTADAALVRKGFLGIRTTALVSGEADSRPVARIASVAPVERETGITEVVLATSDLDRRYLEELKARIGSDVSLIVGGEITASTLPGPECLEALGEFARQSRSRGPAGESGPLLGRIDCQGGPHRVILSPFEVGFMTVGVYAQSLSQVDLLAEIHRLRRYALITAGVMLAVAVLIYTWVVRRITRPLRGLSMAARNVAAGDLGGSVEVRTADEVGELGRTFNNMVRELRESRRQLEDHHQRAMERADRLATIGELASGIAHEIRNPLAGISGAMELMRAGRGFKQNRGEILDEVMNQIRRLENLTRDLLSYSRPAHPKPAPQSMNHILESTLFLLETAPEHSGVTIVKNYDPELPAANVDSSQIQQVFLNILLNALQAMPDGGEISLTTSAETENGRPRIRVQIEDQGIGMSPECLRRAVTPFFTTKHRGTGLGLSIAQRIMDSHDGTVDIKSVEGEGTTFILSFPVYQLTDPS